MFIVQTAATPIAQHLVELLIMVNAAKLTSAKRITAVIPGTSMRQDKKRRGARTDTCAFVADLLRDRWRRPGDHD
jgi:ribose-phosphate pyrophosphokinase